MLNRKARGFTLIEIIIVLAVLAVLAAIVTPNVSGFLTRSKQEAWEADRNTLQAAVDAWHSNVRGRSGDQWPIRGSALGAPTSAAHNGVIDISELVDEGYLKTDDTVKSANTTDVQGHGTTATNSPSGSYTWYVDASGVVHSYYTGTAATDFVSNVYP